MKICPICRSAICEPAIHCEGCLRARLRRALELLQPERLRQVEAGKGDLVMRAQANVRHVQMFEGEQTFCGRRVLPANHKTYLSWDDYLDGGRVCPACRAELERIRAGGVTA